MRKDLYLELKFGRESNSENSYSGLYQGPLKMQYSDDEYKLRFDIQYSN